MKRHLRFYFLAFIISVACYNSSAQYLRYQYDSGWFFDMNIGSAYTESDIKSSPGGGVGFMFGKCFPYNETTPINFELRLRYLHAIMYGQNEEKSYDIDNNPVFNGNVSSNNAVYDEILFSNQPEELNYSDSTGFIFHNHKTTLNRFALELGLTFNRLRNRTGIIFTIHGGIGITNYRVKTDQLDSDGKMYDYSLLDTTGGDPANIRDGSYETEMQGFEGKRPWRFMPSVGVSLGYQISPRFSIGLHHKMTFAMNNNIDGNIHGDDLNDRYHYTNIGVRWNIGAGRGHHEHDHHTDPDIYTHTDTDNTDNTQQTYVSVPKPVVDITDPYNNPYTTTQSTFNLLATVKNIDNASQIKFKQNGSENINFSYNPSSDDFSSYVVLQPGENVFEIRAENEAGSDYESRVIIYEKPQITAKPPIVSISNPPYSGYTTTSQQFNVTASIFNISSASQVTYTVNGSGSTNFTYNPSSKGFSSTINLAQGSNTIKIQATNAAGTDSKTTTIYYEKPVETVPQPPIITILNPSLNPYTVSNSTGTVNASILHVSSKSQINVKVNGVSTQNFNFNLSSHIMSISANLTPGSNIFEISATNNDGSDYAATTIIYEVPEPQIPPSVTITLPAVNPTTVYTANHNVHATVLNVDSKNDISVKINGIPTSNFSYSLSSKTLTLNSNLTVGSNLFEISATNNYGSDYASTTIIRKVQNTEQPPIVTITSPVINPYTVNSPGGNVIATVLNVNGAQNITLKINGQQSNAFSYNNSTKIMQINTTLQLGTNIFAISAVNSAGQDQAATTIIYEVAAQPQPPVVTITQPTQSPKTVNVSHSAVLAKVLHVNSANDITLKINGQQSSAFTYDLSTRIMSLTAPLNVGSNVVEVTATNQDGTDQDATTIVYNKITDPCDEPVVTFTQPAQSPFQYVNASAKFLVQAKVENVQLSNQIQFICNGSPENILFNSTTKVMTGRVVLQPGANVIQIIGTNNCGESDETLIVNYQEENEPCDLPEVTWITPQANQTTQNQQFTATATVLNVSNASGIVFKINGQSNSNFTFDPATHTFSTTQNLQVGNNTLLLEASNDCGNESASASVEREQCNEPTIVVTAQPNSPTYSNSAAITATVSGVSLPKDIRVYLNGSSVNFTYNNGTLTFSQPLQVGNNTFEIQATNECGSSNNTITIERQVCNLPVINIAKPSSLTLTSQVEMFEMRAYVMNISGKSDITVTLNGVNTGFQYEAGNSKVVYVNQLQDGQNTVVITATNSCGSSSETINVEYDAPDPCVAPAVSLSAPANNGTVTNSTVSLAGFAQNIDQASQLQITVNGSAVNASFDAQNGSFSGSIQLNPGSNTIQVSASNECGSDNETATVVYDDTPPCVAPVLTLVNPQPGQSPMTTTNSPVSLDAQVTNIAQQSGVTVKLDGSPVNFTFDQNTGSISVSPAFSTSGQHTVTVNASNACGSDDISFIFDYQPAPPCTAPTVNINAPGNNSTVINPGLSISGTTQHIDQNSQIQLTVNGTTTSTGFNSATGAFNTTTQLNPGANTIVLTVTNDCGTDNSTVTVTYDDTPPCVAPTVSLSTPANNATVTSAGLSINGSTQNIDQASQIQLTVNGTAVTPSLNAQSGAFGANVQLTPGSNSISVTVTNDCGTDNASLTINYYDDTPPCVPPTISLVSPQVGQSPMSTSSSSETLTAQVANISQQSGISATIDGATLNFSWNQNTGQVTATPGFTTAGQYTVVISVNNNCGSDNVSFVYDYQTTSSGTGGGNQSGSCTPVINVDFSADNLCVDVVSSKDLSNVVLKFQDGVEYKFDNLSGTTGNFCGQGANQGKQITGVWVKSGCNGSNDGPGYGDWFPNPNPICTEPTVGITAPSNNGTVTNASISISGTSQNLTQANQIQLSVNGTSVNANYNAQTGAFNANATLNPGANTIAITGTNSCGTDSKTVSVTYDDTPPCIAPTVNLTAPANNSTVTNSATTITGSTQNIDLPSQVELTVNGSPISVTLDAQQGTFTANATLTGGANTIEVTVTNDCGNDNKSLSVTFDNCVPPTVTLTSPSNNSTVSTASVSIAGSSQNITQSSQLQVLVNGSYANANFNAQSGSYTANATLNPGSNNIEVIVTNDCGTDSKTITVEYEEPACGPRFNPGNSDWQFCLITPSGTYNRDDLANNSNFSYSGPASSIYFKPIAGGGDATVNGQPYTLQNGQYYLFTGSLTVDVSTSHPGSMGHWSVCLDAGSSPQHGNGNNRPTSPCETTNGNGNGNGNSGASAGDGGGNGGNGGGNRSGGIDDGGSNEAGDNKQVEEEARKKAAEEAAKKKAAEEAARKKAAEEAAKKKAAEEAARKKAAKEAARKKAAEEAARKKAAEEAARKKAAEEAAKKKAAAEAARKKAEAEKMKREAESRGGR